jgi:nucleoside-diphosphate-sugar epimerase
VSVRRNLVTGATGLLGSHVVEQLLARGERVRALVRPSSDTTWLRSLGVELAEGDLGRPETLPPAIDGCDAVYHCAARVGDWGPWNVFQEAIIDATANVLKACEQVGVGRLLHVSSINVYGRPRLKPGQWLSEEDPLGRSTWVWDHYCKAKIQAEALVSASSLPWTVVRPSWIYGPRDRNSMPRVLKALDAGRAAMIGRGDNLLNIVYAADVADGAVRAATSDVGRRRAYNLASEGAITQKAFLDALTDALGKPRVRYRFPYWLAFTGGFLAECVGRAIRLGRPPHFTRYAVALIGRSTRFSIERARQELGWEPRMPPLEGLRLTLEWLRERQGGTRHATLR